MLQRTLFGTERVLPGLTFEFLGRRIHFSRGAAEWLVGKGAKAVGFGNGVAIEHNVEHEIDPHAVT